MRLATHDAPREPRVSRRREHPQGGESQSQSRETRTFRLTKSIPFSTARSRLSSTCGLRPIMSCPWRATFLWRAADAAWRVPSSSSSSIWCSVPTPAMVAAAYTQRQPVRLRREPLFIPMAGI
jgi:hypothetical protein